MTWLIFFVLLLYTFVSFSRNPEGVEYYGNDDGDVPYVESRSEESPEYPVENMDDEGNIRQTSSDLSAAHLPEAFEDEDDVMTPNNVISICRLPIHPGFCQGRFRAWGFDWKAKVCKPFVYNGCLGNANIFAKKELCESLCLLGKKFIRDGSEPDLDDYDNPKKMKF